MSTNQKIKNAFIWIAIAIFIIGGTYIIWGRSNSDSRDNQIVFTTQSQEDFSCDNVTTIPQNECKALKDLYTTTQGKERNTNTNWLMHSNPCSRHGVSCEAGHVTTVNLSKNNLTGTLPASLGFLHNLQGLYLGKNKISGPIPPALGQLRSVKQLQLSKNRFTDVIPPELANIGLDQNNTHVFLEDNALCGPIPETFFKANHIATFSVAENNLTINLDMYEMPGKQRIESMLPENDKNSQTPGAC